LSRNPFRSTHPFAAAFGRWTPTRGQEARNLRVYDGQPVHDHFKRIGDNAVMGIMHGKEALDR
jgi:hypothetical protein